MAVTGKEQGGLGSHILSNRQCSQYRDVTKIHLDVRGVRVRGLGVPGVEKTTKVIWDKNE